LDKTAWTISAALLGAGVDKLVALGYLSPEVALASGIAVGGTLLVKEIGKYLKDKNWI
jgi:hypothetical protein